MKEEKNLNEELVEENGDDLAEEKEPSVCDCGECQQCVEEKGKCDCGDCDMCAKEPEVTEDLEDSYDDLEPEDMV